MGILDLLFPKYCVSCKKLGSYLCADCFSYLSFDVFARCAVCNRQAIDGITHKACRGRYTIDGTFAAIAYKGVAKKLLYTFKYKPYLTDVKTVLCDLFYESLIQKERFHEALSHSPSVVPIPLHASRWKKRGYNQAAILALGLAEKLGLPFMEVLERTKETRSQVGLDREKRRENVAGAFSLSPNPPAGGSQYPNIFLIDDVLTTGATLSEAARVLKKEGTKKVFGVTFAIDQ